MGNVTERIGRRVSDTERLKPFLQAVGSYSPDLIFGVQQQLFHYTDLSGFQGIVTNHDLWLTHLRYSNDEEEMVHGQKLVMKVIDDKRKAQPSSEWIAFLDSVQQELSQQVDVYISCFCLEDDLLSQWRGYGSNGSGVSIMIDPNEFEWLTGPDSPPGGLLRVWKVFYDQQVQRNIVWGLLDAGINQPRAPDERAKDTSAAIQFFVPTFKNASFSGEQECRLVFTPAASFQLSPRFRVRGGVLLPYFSLKDLRQLRTGVPEQLPIRGVRIGPSVNKLLNKGSAEMMLRAAGYDSVPVEGSVVPFRG